MTKQKMLLDLLTKYKRGRSVIQVWQAIGAVQAYDLVHKLRKKGHNIITIEKTGLDRWGNKVKYAIYRLEA